MNLDINSPSIDLDVSDMSHAQLCEQVLYLLKRVKYLEQFQEDAFAVSPNIDLAIEYWKRANK